MVLKSDQQRIKTLLQEAIPLLCKNGLSYQSEFCIEALIGITLDQNDVFLVNINERVCSVEKSSSSSFHEETRIECGGTGDARSVDLCDPVSENEGRDNIKTVQKFRIASQSLFRKQTRACARESGEDVSESKNFDRYSNGGRSSEKRRIKETEAHSDFADSYEVSVDADFGSPPLKKQAREWGSDTQTHIKQEPEFCEIIDPSDTEPDDNDFKDPRTFSAVPTTSENTAESSADMYSMYSAGLDGLEASSSVPSGTPSGSGVTSYAGSVLNRSSSLAQALPELSMTSPPVAGQSTVGCGQLPSYPANPSQKAERKPIIGDQVLRLSARCFPDWIPVKPGTKKPHPLRECKACNTSSKRRQGRQGFKRKRTSFWCATCQVALCVPICFHAYHNYTHFKRYVHTPATGTTPESESSESEADTMSKE